jgi:hypothetical protein
MATLPPIPDKPTDRPETWTEYAQQCTRLMVADFLASPAASPSSLCRSLSLLH